MGFASVLFSAQYLPVACMLGERVAVREIAVVSMVGRRVRWAGIAALLVICLGAASASAEEDATVRRVVVFGDSQAQGVAGGLQRVLLDDPRYKVLNHTHPGAALVHSDTEWMTPVQSFIDKEKAKVAVIMFGANDRLDLRDENGKYVHFRSEDWRAAYAKRVDRILTALNGAGIKIIWCGNPIARSPTYSADMSYINDIVSGEVSHFGGEFLPLWTVIADNQGQFIAYGRDRAGVTERLRNDDGIHFTAAGYELIAERVISVLPQLQANGR
jgi:hypothetical protein